MFFYVFIVSVIATTYAETAENYACYNLKELCEKAKPIHDKCGSESKAASHKDKAACYLSYRICHLTALGALNEAGNGVDHEKMVSILVKLANKEKADVIKANIQPCSALKTDDVDKIQPYFDCIEEKLSKDCPEIVTHREHFREEFEGAAIDIC